VCRSRSKWQQQWRALLPPSISVGNSKLLNFNYQPTTTKGG
jgi:hypothetical protein